MMPRASVRGESPLMIRSMTFSLNVDALPLGHNRPMLKELGSHARSTFPRQQPHNVQHNGLIFTRGQKGTPGFEPGTC